MSLFVTNRKTITLALRLALAITSLMALDMATTGGRFVASSKTIAGLLMAERPVQMRFCYQPGDQQGAPLASQCVYCNKNLFDNTLLRCTGISAVTQYINTTQAFCIITQCLEQVSNQTPLVLG